MTEKIIAEIENGGPIRSATLEFVPGVNILKGTNGIGKSNAIELLKRVLGIAAKTVTITDGEEKATVTLETDSGTRKLTIGKNTRVTGDCGYVGVDAAALATLIDPGLKGEDACDEARIVAALKLIDAEPDCESAEALYKTSGVPIPKELCEFKSILDQVKFMKADLQQSARMCEKESEQEKGKAVALRGSSSDIDLTAECDADKLQAALESAIQAESDLKSQATAADNQAKSLAEAEAGLNAAKSSYSGPTVTQATEEWQKATALQKQRQIRVTELEAELQIARNELLASNAAVEAAVTAGRSARQHEETMVAWKKTIESGRLEKPTDDQLTQATAAVSAARKAVEQGAIIRRAKEQSDAIQGHASKAKELASKAKRLREAADSTDDILSGAVAKANCPLKVKRGRLVIKTDRDAAELFSELSDGERAMVALELAINSIPDDKKAMIPLDQSIWAEMLPATQKRIAEQAKSRGAVVITGELTDGETLESEVL